MTERVISPFGDVVEYSEDESEAPVFRRAKDVFSGEEMAELRKISTWRAWWAIVHCWGVVIATWVIVSIWTNPLTILLGIMVIGTRQLGFGIISHDGAHYTLFKNKRLNDWACEWLLSRPLTGGTIHAYRKYHLQHHRHTQQENDPDLHLSKPFPISRASLRRKIWRDLSGQTGWKQYGALFRASFSGDTLIERLRNGFQRLGGNILINVGFLGAFALFGDWWMYFVLWWIPALTWNRFIVRLRNIGEHAAVPDDDDRLRNTRTTTASWLERAFIAPYRVSWHLEHHLLVTIPWYRLPRAHELLLAKGLGPKMEVQPSFPAMLQQVVHA